MPVSAPPSGSSAPPEPASGSPPGPFGILADGDGPTAAAKSVPRREVAPPPTVGEPRGLAPFDVLGNYQILRQLGGGGMAHVYLARSRLGGQVDKLVALKTVLPEFGPQSALGSLFLEEARISATLQHPNVVQVFDYGEVEGRPFLAMEYLQGPTLSTVLTYLSRNRIPPRVEVAVALVVQVCRGLEYVHARTTLDGSPLNLVHRDVSPANILITPQGEVKLLDFGVAAVEGAKGLETAVGKFGYMPEDQARGETPVANWDTYSLGAVLYELLTLTRFSRAGTAAEVVRRASETRDRRPSLLNGAVGDALDAIVLKATAPHAVDRYASAAHMRVELAAVQAGLPSADIGAFVEQHFGKQIAAAEVDSHRLFQESHSRLTIPPPLGSHAKARSRRRWLALGASAVVLLGGLAVATRPSHPPIPALSIVTPAVAPALSATVTVSLNSTPPGAIVSRSHDGQELGHTPLAITLPRSDSSTAVRLALAGHEPVEKSFKPSADLSIDVTLAPERTVPSATGKVSPVRAKKPKRPEVIRDGFVDPFAR